MNSPGASVDFFVRYAESQGGLSERVPEGAVLALPEDLCRQLDVPEDLAVTEDPEVSREDDYLLLAAGHPLLLNAAKAVFAQGDVGWSKLPWPSGPPPAPKDLEERIRQQLYPDHGRVDVHQPPRSAHLLVVCVGALVSYRISVEEQVHELEEVWTFSDASQPVPEDLQSRLRSGPGEPGAPPGITPDVRAGVAAADRLLRARANDRAAELARQTASRLHAQLGIVDDYYRRVLESVEERRARAAEERAPLLAAQAEATQAEWSRRRTEVTDELKPSIEIIPVRLHVVGVPAFLTQTVVRRGAREYPLPVVYLPLTSSFLPPICPFCGATRNLVAGKARLGCQACIAPATPAPAASPPDGSAETRSTPAGTTQSPSDATTPPTLPPPADEPPAAPTPAKHPTRPTGPRSRSSGRVTPKGTTGRVTPKGSRRGETWTQTGSRLAISFWQSVFNGQRLGRRDCLPGSPLDALLRLYGARGPALIVGLRTEEFPMGVNTATEPAGPDGVALTDGELITSADRELSFTIRWRAAPSTTILEVEGFALERVGHLLTGSSMFNFGMRERLEGYLRPPPTPLVALDAPATLLLRKSAELLGLSFAARCLAAWWAVTEPGDESADHGRDSGARTLTVRDSLAAAVEVVVAKRMGIHITATSAAERYATPVEGVRRDMRRLQTATRDLDGLGW